eukprot:6187932-Pleurochrysis_carterae.AAC.1
MLIAVPARRRAKYRDNDVLCRVRHTIEYLCISHTSYMVLAYAVRNIRTAPETASLLLPERKFICTMSSGRQRPEERGPECGSGHAAPGCSQMATSYPDLRPYRIRPCGKRR